MANIGLRKPIVAKYDRNTKSYSGGFQYSHAVSVNITPNYAEASLYGDDIQVEYEKTFNNATISLGTTSTPVKAAETVFGHSITEDNEVSYNATDEANYVGVGFVSPEKVDGESKYSGAVITCAKFADSAESYATKGDSLTFNTPTIEGVAIPDEDGEWKRVKVFDSANEALAYVKNILNTCDELTVSPESDNVEMFGTIVADMQTGLAVANGAITGTLKYLDSGALVDQWGAGNFMALKFTGPDESATSVKVGLSPSEGSGLVELDEDMNGAFKVTDKDNQKFVVDTTIGNKHYITYYDLSGLVLETN